MGVDVVDLARAARRPSAAPSASSARRRWRPRAARSGGRRRRTGRSRRSRRRSCAPRRFATSSSSRMSDAGAFADDEAVAILVERPAGALGLVVARRERAHRAKPPTPIGVIDASEPPAIITSASPRLMISKASPIECADAVHAVHVARFGPAGAEADRHLAGRQVDDRRGNEERRDAARAAVEELDVLALDRAEPADARRDEDADLVGDLRRHLELARPRPRTATPRSRTG